MSYKVFRNSMNLQFGQFNNTEFLTPIRGSAFRNVLGGMQHRVGLEFEFEFVSEIELDFEMQFELNLIKLHLNFARQMQGGKTTKNY